jgi:tRNA uridine 5-carboxymethylaminomethyl modification enzyme
MGVMIDDLVTRGVSGPYRMFTSRAEYRLTLRADNADQRLTGKGIAAGVVGSERSRAFRAKAAILAAARELAGSLAITPSQAARHGLKINQNGVRRTVHELLAYPGIAVADLAGIWPDLAALPPYAAEQLEIDAKYSSYLGRQNDDIESFRRDEGLALPNGLDYWVIPGLSNEARQKLASARPQTLGQAARTDGITPAALTILLAHVRKGGVRRSA